MKVFKKAIENIWMNIIRKRLHSEIDYKTPNEIYYGYINNLDFRGAKWLQLVWYCKRIE